MKKTFEIKNRFSGEIIYSGEHTTMIECISKALNIADLRGADLREADLSRADLREADLIGANLIGANLSRADLMEADLREADLIGANLIGANLREAKLSGSNLSRANLREADLREADLIGANLSRADLMEAKMPLHCKWSFGIIDDKIFIGCKEKTAKEWEDWLVSDEVYSTKRGTPEFKQIEACIRAGIAYYNTLNQ